MVLVLDVTIKFGIDPHKMDYSELSLRTVSLNLLTSSFVVQLLLQKC